MFLCLGCLLALYVSVADTYHTYCPHPISTLIAEARLGSAYAEVHGLWPVPVTHLGEVPDVDSIACPARAMGGICEGPTGPSRSCDQILPIAAVHDHWT